uniref:Fibrinogen C-terminal domain-containing protein n=1 Tax=Branchiostoma floridae TaxID=7739 RepID=C3ZQ28_BRAFL|eukprot:XP_002589396.1 hypothetical protein BRAFLDRAFT_77839 [Branchiostoma floridae]
MEPYAVKYQEEDADDDKDHRPDSMEPYAVRNQEKDADDDEDHQPASIMHYHLAENYVVRYQEEDSADDRYPRPASMQPYAVYGPDLGASNPVYGPDLGASNPVYGHDLKGTDPDTNLRPASIEPDAVRYQEDDADDDIDHQPASMEPYAVAYQDKDAADDFSMSQERGAACTSGNDAGTSGNDAGISGNDAGTSGNDAGTYENDAGTSGNDAGTSGNDARTSVPRRNDRNKRGTRKPRHAQGVPHGPREAAGDTTPMQQTDWQARADAAANIPNLLYASGVDRTYPGGVSGRCALCSSIRSQLIYMAAGIAVLLSLVAMVFALLAFINNGGISELTITVDALKRNQDNMSATDDALKRNQDNMSATDEALKRKQDNMSATVDALKRDLDNMSAFVDALKLELHKERNRIAALEQRLNDTSPGGGWTVIQRRQDGWVPFNRNWEEYKLGFGNKNGEYWLGNDNIHFLTNQKNYRLRIDLLDWQGESRWAEYSTFR